MSQVTKEYFYNRVIVNAFLIVALLSAGIIIMGLFINRFLLPAGASLVFPLILYFMYKNYTVLRLFDTHMEIQIAPMRSKEFVDYKDVKDIETVSGKIIIHSENKKPVKLSLSIFNSNQREEIVKTLKQKIS